MIFLCALQVFPLLGVLLVMNYGCSKYIFSAGILCALNVFFLSQIKLYY